MTNRYVPLAVPTRMPAARFSPTPTGSALPRIAAGSNSLLTPLGAGGVPPSGVAALVFQLTGKAILPSGTTAGGGKITAYPSGLATVPGTSNMNLNVDTSIDATLGLTKTELVTVQLGAADNKIALNNGGNLAVDVTADVLGYYAANDNATAATYVPVQPARIPPATGDPSASTPISATGTVTISPGNKAGLPGAAGMVAVAAHIHFQVTGSPLPTGTGSITVYPTGVTKPATTDVSYTQDGFHTNTVVVKPGTGGSFSVTNAGLAGNVFVDVVGYYVSGAGGSIYAPITPFRIAGPVNLGAMESTHRNDSYEMLPLGQAGIPTTGVAAIAYVLHAANNSPGSAGVAAYPSDAPSLVVSSVGYHRTGFWSALQQTKLGSNGRITITNKGMVAVSIWVDIVGYFRMPATPEPPTQMTAGPANGAAVVSWQPQPPAEAGPELDYTVTAAPGGATTTVTGSSATLTGLTNGTDYTFTVRARYLMVRSAESAPSEAVTPAAPAPPGAPLIVSTYTRDSAVAVTWVPPATGAGSVAGYVITASPGTASVTVDGDAREAIITGLANGTAYRITVSARNANGTGIASNPTATLVPTLAVPPLKPSLTAVVPLDSGIDVQWVPAVDGGSPVTGYTVTAGPVTMHTAADTTVARLTGLTNGTAYDVRVTATNAAGTGDPVIGHDVVPAAHRAPQPPTDVRSETTAAGTVLVTWKPPADFGASPVSSYRVMATPATGTPVSATSSTTTTTLTGLDTSQQYQITVAATNADGTSPSGAAAAAVQPVYTRKLTPYTLTAADLAALRGVHGNALDFEQPPAPIRALTAGAVIVAGSTDRLPGGLFREVTGVDTSSGLTVVHTRDAAFDDVFGDADAAFGKTVTSDDLHQLTGLNPGVRLREPIIHGRTVGQGAPRLTASTKVTPHNIAIGIRSGSLIIEVEKDLLEQDYGDRKLSGGRIEAQITFTPILEGHVHVGPTGISSSFKIGYTAQTQIRVRFGLGAKRTIELGHTRDFNTGCFTVFFVPVCTFINFGAKLEASAAATITWAATYTRTGGFQLTQHNLDVSASKIEDAGNHLDADSRPQLAGEVSFKFLVPVEEGFKFPGTDTKVAMEASPYLELRADTTQDPWWELRDGISIGGKLRLGLLGKYVEWEEDDLFSFFVTLAHADGPFFGLSITPTWVNTVVGTDIPFGGHFQGYPDSDLHWEISQGVGQIDPLTGHFVSNTVGAAAIRASSPRNEFHPDLEAFAIVVVGPRPPTAPLNVKVTRAPLALDVTWDPPTSDGGAPIISYGVAVGDVASSGPLTGTARSAHIRGLAPNVPYQVYVIATNAAGQSPLGAAPKPVAAQEAVARIGSTNDLATDEQGAPDSSGEVGMGGVAVSGDGQYAFFAVPPESNLAPPDLTGGSGLYLVRKDMQTGQLEVASRGLDGTTPVPIISVRAALPALDRISGVPDRAFTANRDGDVVAFRPLVSTVAPYPIYVHRIAEFTTWQTNTGGVLPPVQPKLSGDGTVLAYLDWSSSPTTEVYRLMRVVEGGVPQRIDACACVDLTTILDMSDDGKKVVYDCGWNGCTTDARDWSWLYDATTGTTVSLAAPDSNSTDRVGCTLDRLNAPQISGNGSTVAAFFLGDCWQPGIFGTPKVAGLVVGPAQAGALGFAQQVDSMVMPAGGPDFTYKFLPQDLSYDGRLVAYGVEPGTEFTGLHTRIYNVTAGGFANVPGPTTGYWDWSLSLAADGRLMLWSRMLQDGSNQPTSMLFKPGVWAQRFG